MCQKQRAAGVLRAGGHSTHRLSERVAGGSLLGGGAETLGTGSGNGFVFKLLTTQAFSTFYVCFWVDAEWHSRSVLMATWMVDTPDPQSQATVISG